MTKRDGSVDPVGREPIISDRYPDRLTDLRNDLEEQRREIAALEQILHEQPPAGLKRRLIRHYIVLKTYEYANCTQRLRGEIAKVAQRINARSRRVKRHPPFHTIQGPRKELQKTVDRLKGPRDKVIAHRYTGKGGKFISIARAESLATWPREEELTRFIEEPDPLAQEASAWIRENEKTVSQNVDRNGCLLR